MLRVLIIDDELNAIKILQTYLHKYLTGTKVVGMANSMKEGVGLVQQTEFDLLLLDINLGDGTGFDLLEQCPKRDFAVIFTTAYDAHAIKAFKYAALDYLLKPIHPEEFIGAFERAKNGQVVKAQQLNQAAVAAHSGTSDRVVVNSSHEIHFLDISEIVHLQSDGNYTDIFCMDRPKITSTKTLKFYEELLSGDRFFRIHQKHLVQLSFITKFLKEEGGGHVLLSNGVKLEVSRRRKDELLQQLLKKQ